jgi:hypothetical protein
VEEGVEGRFGRDDLQSEDGDVGGDNVEEAQIGEQQRRGAQVGLTNWACRTFLSKQSRRNHSKVSISTTCNHLFEIFAEYPIF